MTHTIEYLDTGSTIMVATDGSGGRWQYKDGKFLYQEPFDNDAKYSLSHDEIRIYTQQPSQGANTMSSPVLEAVGFFTCLALSVGAVLGIIWLIGSFVALCNNVEYLMTRRDELAQKGQRKR